MLILLDPRREYLEFSSVLNFLFIFYFHVLCLPIIGRFISNNFLFTNSCASIRRKFVVTMAMGSSRNFDVIIDVILSHEEYLRTHTERIFWYFDVPFSIISFQPRPTNWTEPNLTVKWGNFAQAGNFEQKIPTQHESL